MNKKTLVIGASPNPERYANKAARLLAQHGHSTELFGKQKGDIDGKVIQNSFPEQIEDLDSVTLYVNPDNQKSLEDKIIALKPKRIIFNPGTENPDFEEKAQKVGIQTEEACTLVLLNTGQY